jgi:hypothetical protein
VARNQRTSTGDRSEQRAASARALGVGGPSASGGKGVNVVRGGSVCDPSSLPLGIIRGSMKAGVCSPTLTAEVGRTVAGSSPGATKTGGHRETGNRYRWKEAGTAGRASRTFKRR